MDIEDGEWDTRKTQHSLGFVPQYHQTTDEAKKCLLKINHNAKIDETLQKFNSGTKKRDACFAR